MGSRLPEGTCWATEIFSGLQWWLPDFKCWSEFTELYSMNFTVNYTSLNFALK